MTSYIIHIWLVQEHVSILPFNIIISSVCQFILSDSQSSSLLSVWFWREVSLCVLSLWPVLKGSVSEVMQKSESIIMLIKNVCFLNKKKVTNHRQESTRVHHRQEGRRGERMGDWQAGSTEGHLTWTNISLCLMCDVYLTLSTMHPVINFSAKQFYLGVKFSPLNDSGFKMTFGNYSNSCSSDWR